MRNWLRAGLATAVLAIAASVSFGQMNVAEISGGVTDPAGDVVQGAAITATNTATGLKFNALTNDSGQYRPTQLAPGVYSVSVSANGFKQVAQENVVLHAGEQLALPFSMVIGAKTETVLVEVGFGVLQTESAQIKDVIQNQQVVDLPVKDREFLELAPLGPGVVNPPGGTRGDSLQQTGKLALLAAPLPAQPQIGGGTCNSATLNGTYSLTLAGRDVSSSVSFSNVLKGVGTATVDGLSKVTFSLTSNINKGSAQLTWAGTYSMQVNCVGALSITSGDTASFILGSYDGGVSYFLDGQDGVYSFIGGGNTQPSGACSASTLNATYEFDSNEFTLSSGTLAGVSQLAGLMVFYALHKELVGSGKMTDRAFHDAIYRESNMSVEMVRLAVNGQKITRDHQTSWKFYGSLA